MARKEQKLTCTFYVGGKQVDKLTPEHLEKMAQRVGEALSIFYTQHLDEYQRLRAETEKSNN